MHRCVFIIASVSISAFLFQGMTDLSTQLMNSIRSILWRANGHIGRLVNYKYMQMFINLSILPQK